MTKIFGIDVSVWQKGIDFKKCKKEGVKFAILRGMYGNCKDTNFETHYKNAKANGLGVGAYQWGKAVNVAQAREEAQIFIDSCLKGKQFEYPIYYDVEDSLLINLSVQDLTDVIKAWAETIENAGYFAGIYMNQSAFENEVKSNELAKLYSQWRAKWTTEKNKPDCQLWQFGGESNYIRSNKIAGYICDQDYAYEDFPKLMKEKGVNGFSKDANTPIKKSIDELAQEVLDGKWGNGEFRKMSLKNAGYNYKLVQNKVNEICNPKNPSTTVKFYKIQKGDNLTKIAEEFNTTITQLMSWNNIKNKHLIYAGQKIRIK